MDDGARLVAPRARGARRGRDSVNDTRRDAVKVLFAAASEMPLADRAAYVMLESGGDAALIAEVQSLLDAHERPGAFLDTVTHEFRSQAFAASAPARGRI